MPRVRNRINAISDDFDALTSVDKVDIVAELFTRLDQGQAAHAMMLMNFWQKRQSRVEVPELMEEAEVKQCGDLALAPNGRNQ